MLRPHAMSEIHDISINTNNINHFSRLLSNDFLVCEKYTRVHIPLNHLIILQGVLGCQREIPREIDSDTIKAVMLEHGIGMISLCEHNNRRCRVSLLHFRRNTHTVLQPEFLVVLQA